MSRLYEDQHRALQDRFESRPMADRIEQIALKTEIGPEDQAFIESRDFFFLTTVDSKCRPTVSYKGGAPGFMRVMDQTHLMFPSYDGNGMYLSMGNITANPHVGFLFIDFERPFRLRVQGEAEVSAAPEHLACFKEAELVVRVKITELWMNCPRYIHRYQRLSASRYVPQADIETPLCEWKRTEPVQDVLRPHELAQVAKAGPFPSRSGSAASSPATKRRRPIGDDSAAGAVPGGAAHLFARRLLARYGGVGLQPVS